MTVTYEMKLKGHMTENTRQLWAHLHRSSLCAELQWSQQTKAGTEGYLHNSTAGSFSIAWYVFLDVLSFEYLEDTHFFFEGSWGIWRQTGQLKTVICPKDKFQASKSLAVETRSKAHDKNRDILTL